MRAHNQPSRTRPALDRTFATAAVMGALGTLGGGILVRRGYGARELSAAACIILALSAMVGMYAQDVVERLQRGELARVYTHAFSGARDQHFEKRSGRPTRFESLGLAFADLIDGVRLRFLGHNTLARWGADMRHQIETGLKESQSLAAGLATDAQAIADAARGSRHAETEYNACLDGVRTRADCAAEATETLMEHAHGLAQAVHAVTLETEKATAIATRLAETAFATQRGVATIGDSTAAVLTAADQVQHILHRAEMLSQNAGIEAARAGVAGRGFAIVAQEVKQLAEAGGSALENMLVTVRDLRQQTALVFKRIEDISDVIQAQHEFGHALSHAAMLQADAVGQVLKHLGAAQGEVHNLNREVHDMALPENRISMSVAAQEAVERLPSYAEAMAQILRGLPDFAAAVKTRKGSKKKGVLF